MNYLSPFNPYGPFYWGRRYPSSSQSVSSVALHNALFGIAITLFFGLALVIIFNNLRNSMIKEKSDWR